MAELVKVLVPLDGSKLAEHALAYVPALKPLGDTRFQLVSVLEGGSRDAERDSLSSYLEEVAGAVQQHTGLAVETKLLQGSPAAALMQEEEDSGADFLVISTHGASGISRWRFGSVTDKLIRGGKCSILVIGPKAAEREDLLVGDGTPPFKDILLPLDGSELAEGALGEAIRFAGAFGSNVHLVRAISSPAMGTDAAAASVAWSNLSEAMLKEAGDYLASMAARFPAGTTTTTEVRMGGAADLLTEYISEKQIDLVVMTTHGRSGLVRTALGSVTDRLLGGEAPVLVVRSGSQE